MRSHDSRYYGKRFMTRLDKPTWEKLEELSTHFDKSIAEVIRQILAHAKPEDFPSSWHIKAAERRPQQVRHCGKGKNQALNSQPSALEVAILLHAM